jgi:hypothetical protein
MAFTNPIVGGDGELVRNQIKSRDYVPGVSGWIIRRDGTVEFSNGVFRGSIVIGGGVVTITENGIVIQTPTGYLSLTPDGGFQVFSPSGDVDGGYAEVTPPVNPDESGRLVLTPPPTAIPGPSFQPFQLFANSENVGGQDRATSFVYGAASITGGAMPAIEMTSAFADESSNPSMKIYGLGRGANPDEHMPILDFQHNVYLRGKAGTVNVSTGGVSTTTFSQAVVFATPFPVGVTPVIGGLTLETGGAPGQLWSMRINALSNAGFTIQGSRSAAVILPSTPVHWTAFVPQS